MIRQKSVAGETAAIRQHGLTPIIKPCFKKDTATTQRVSPTRAGSDAVVQTRRIYPVGIVRPGKNIQNFY
jgi:hypothetical protein